MADLSEQQRAWLKLVRDRTGLSLTAIARKAGKHDSTLTGFMKGERQGALSSSTIRAIEDAIGIPFSHEDAYLDAVQAVGQRGAASSIWDLEDVGPVSLDSLPGELRGAVAGAMLPDDQLWRVQTRRLEAAGYLVGDVLVVRPGLAPTAQDLVLVERKGQRPPGAFAALLFQPPFVVTAAIDPRAEKPALVDEQSLRIVGPVVLTARRRRSEIG